MSRWFRHYAGMMRDDKLVGAAIRAKQPVERVVWVWGAILESAAEINDGGRYEFDIAEVSYFLRADEADICAVIDALTNAGRLAAGVVVNWGARQFQSDRSAPRQAAYRERKRSRDSGCDDQKEHGDVVVTSPDRHGDAPETETETETNTEADIIAARAPTKPQRLKKSRARQKVSIPEGFLFSQDTRNYAVKLGFSSPEIEREHQRFIRHARQNDRRCADWEAAAENWFDKAAEFSGKPIPIDPAVAADALKGKFYAAAESPQLEAWDRYSISLRGVRMMRDRNQGWLVDSEWPPGYSPPAEPKQPSTHHEGRA
jgi:hypothetical protein